MTERELTEYAKYMVERGDTLGMVRTFLNKKITDDKFISRTMKYLEEFYKTVQADKPDSPISLRPSNLVNWILFDIWFLTLPIICILQQ